jgi:hypothetical protein
MRELDGRGGGTAAEEEEEENVKMTEEEERGGASYVAAMAFMSETIAEKGREGAASAKYAASC